MGVLRRIGASFTEALPAAGEPGGVEAAAAGSVGDDHGAHLAVVKAAVHLLLHAVCALVPKRAQRQEDEPTVAHHCDARLRPARTASFLRLLKACKFFPAVQNAECCQ